MIENYKNTIYSSLFIIAVTIGLSEFADVPYIYTLCGFAAWVAFGHLITVDDDMPGEWSNLEGDKNIWRSSLVTLLFKFLVFVILVVLVLSFPTLAKFGA
jgi:hypothetical protein